MLVYGDVTRFAVRISDILEAMIRLPEFHIFSLFCLYPLTHPWSTFSSSSILRLIVHLLYMNCTYCSVWGRTHGLSTTQPSTLLHFLPLTLQPSFIRFLFPSNLCFLSSSIHCKYPPKRLYQPLTVQCMLQRLRLVHSSASCN